MKKEIEKVTPTHRIKIISSAKPTYWYSNMIGNEFDAVVDKEFMNKWNVVDGSGEWWIKLLIDKSDIEIIKRYDHPATE